MEDLMKKLISILLIISLIFTTLTSVTFAAASANALPLIVDSYANGTLKIHWTPVSGALTISTPSGILDSSKFTSDSAKGTATITGLKADIIYDISVNIASVPAKTGFLYFLPKITFYVGNIDEVYDPLTGGGEIGKNPKLNIKWAIPQIMRNGIMTNANNPAVLADMQNNLKIYNDQINLTNLEYRVNFNSGSPKASINITPYDNSDFTTPKYKTYLSGDNAPTNPPSVQKVRDIDSAGFLNFDLKGWSGEGAEPISTDYELADRDIMPGTVYYFSIKPWYVDNSQNPVSALKVGDPSYQNESPITTTDGSTYSYTPVRFSLWNDSLGNVYSKIYRMDSGSLTMPGLYYEIQASDDPTILEDWKSKTTMNDQFFPAGSTYAITGAPKTNATNTTYYRVVVRSDEANVRLVSQSIPFIVANNTSKPSTPINVTTIPPHTFATGDGHIKGLTFKNTASSDILISWDKPSNWSIIKANTDPTKDMYFHIMISTNQTRISMENSPPINFNGAKYYYPVEFRLVKYISSKSVKENGNHLEYTLKGFDLFTGENFEGLDSGNKPIIASESISNQGEQYPDFFLPNKVYYLKMYTTEASQRGLRTDDSSSQNSIKADETELDHISEYSIVTSFTTLSGNQFDVPLPKNFRVNKNDSLLELDENNISVVASTIELQFDKVDVNWANYDTLHSVTDSTYHSIYYDLYMGTSTDPAKLVKIGSTQKSNSDLNKGVVFANVNDQATFITTTIKKFENDFFTVPNPSGGSPYDPYESFGSRLKPNTAYFFAIKTRLNVVGQTPDAESSIYTAIIPVTTQSGPIPLPDANAKRPLAPDDFTISEDAAGNPDVTGSHASFSWTNKENDVVYKLICVSNYLSPNALDTEYTGDLLYKSFRSEFGDIILNPSSARPISGFSFNSTLNSCKYAIDKWLFPNKLYYFAIRAERYTGTTLTSYSAWVSIPVTTSLIDPPLNLEIVSDIQLGFFWRDNDVTAKTQDYHIYIKTVKDNDFTLLTDGRKFDITEDGFVKYARLKNLKPNTAYDIKVYKGSNPGQLMYTSTGLLTRDSKSQLEIRWKGLSGDPYQKYEVVIKTTSNSDYELLSDSDFEEYANTNGVLQPYYTENTIKTSSFTGSYHYARVKTMFSTVSGNIKQRQPLASNTQFYIKVRSVKIDPRDNANRSYSKYIGPVSPRTEFSQDKYDEEEKEKERKTKLLDRLASLEKNLVWRMGIDDGNGNRLFLKADKLQAAMDINRSNSYVLDISFNSILNGKDVVYLPGEFINYLNKKQKSLVIKTKGSDYTIKSGSINLDSISLQKDPSKPNYDNLIVIIEVNKIESSSIKLHASAKVLTPVYNLSTLIMSSQLTQTELVKDFSKKLYDSESGIIREKLDLLSSNTISSGLGKNPDDLDNYIQGLIVEMQNELSDYIAQTIEGSGSSSGVLNLKQELTSYNKPLEVKLSYSTTKLSVSPYALMNGDNTWKKLSPVISNTANNLSFNTSRPGKFIAASSGSIKYGLDDILNKSGKYSPSSSISGNDMILVYERITGKTSPNVAETSWQKTLRLGLSGLINQAGLNQKITRQQAAGFFVSLYAIRNNIRIESIRPLKKTTFADEKFVSSKYYKFVLLSLDLKLMTLNSKQNFNPSSFLTTQDLLNAIDKL